MVSRLIYLNGSQDACEPAARCGLNFPVNLLTSSCLEAEVKPSLFLVSLFAVQKTKEVLSFTEDPIKNVLHMVLERRSIYC